MDACYLSACHGVILAITCANIVVDQGFKHEASLSMLCFWCYVMVFQTWAWCARYVYTYAHVVETMGFLVGFVWTIFLLSEFTLFQTWFIMSALAYILSVCIRGRRCLDALQPEAEAEAQRVEFDRVEYPPLSLVRIEETSDQPSCAICLDTVESHAWAQTSTCQHHLHHATCLETWQRSSTDRRCPLCRV
jgi:Ring finger domain